MLRKMQVFMWLLGVGKHFAEGMVSRKGAKAQS
jgi:hypothetical protein